MGKIRYILSSSLKVWISPNGGEREQNNQISWLNGKREFGCQVKAKGRYYDVIVNRKRTGLYRWRKPSMSTCWLVFHSGSLDSLCLSLWVKSLNRCVSSAKGIQLTVELLLTQGILTTWLEVLRNQHWFFIGGFLLDDYSWDSHIFRNDLCVIYTDFHGCGLKLLLYLDGHLFVIFFSDLFFFFMCFSQLIQPWILLRELYGTITIWWEK